jgi:hypothetical protein
VFAPRRCAFFEHCPTPNFGWSFAAQQRARSVMINS